MPIKLEVGKWYWIQDPGSNMHRGYTGPAKCRNNIKEHVCVGGATYEFEFYDKDGGENGEGGYAVAHWGDDDIVRECSGPNSLGEKPDLRPVVEALLERVTDIEGRLKRITELEEELAALREELDA